jgi:hypothetical protein
MLVLARISVFSRIAAAAAVWLCFAGPAWAGSGGGADLGGPQSALNDACDAVGITFCPKLPTVNQLVIENAALSSTTPAAVRQNQNLSSEKAVDAGSTSGLANPLAFISPPNGQGQPIPISPTDPAYSATNSFLTATTTPTNGHPTLLDLTFDNRLRTAGFMLGQQDLIVGEIMLPLVKGDAHQNVSPDDLSSPQLATLQIKADPSTCPTCVTTDIIANLTGAPVTYQLSQLGMTFSNDNSNAGSMNFSPNEQFTVGIPLLVPADFLNPQPPGPAYLFSASGHEFANGLFDGIDPVANFLDASFVSDNSGTNLLLAAVADLAIVRNGTTIISDPVPTPEASTLALLGSGLFGLALLRRWRSARRVEPEG